MTQRESDETALVGSTLPDIHFTDVPATVADFLANDRRVALTIRPAPDGETDRFRITWQQLAYSEAQDRWLPVHGRSTNTSLWHRLSMSLRRVFNTVGAFLQGIMPTFDVDREQINVFVVNDTYVFKHYFDQDELFGQLEQYYNRDAYRFELPTEAAFETAATILDEFFYDLTLVDDIEPFCVVTQQGKDHSELMQSTVVKFDRGRHNIHLLQDQVSVDQAVERGAVPLEDAPVDL